jgi:hypothetical protein
MIPAFEKKSGNLPPGIHDATIEEVLERFDWRNNLSRASRSKALRDFFDFVKQFAIDVYIDGSYVTSKLAPGDVDLVVVLAEDFQYHSMAGIILENMIALNDDPKKELHIFRCKERSDPKLVQWISLFCTDKHTKRKKGIIRVRVR